MPDKKNQTDRSDHSFEILESLGDGLFALDRNWCFIYLNQRAASNFGYQPGDLRGQNLWEKIPKIGGTEHETHYRQAMQEGRSLEFETAGVLSDQWYHIQVHPSSQGISILWHDITDRKQAEELVRLRGERFRILIENVRAGVALIDEQGRFDTVNSSFLKMFGLSQESTIMNVNSQDWSAWQVYAEDGKNLLHVDEHPVRKAALTGKPVRNSLVGVRLPGGGDLTWMIINAEPVLKPDGRILYLIATYSDITELKQTTEALARAKEDLENKVKERTRKLAEANEQLVQYSHRITHVQEEERKRIAYELHDDTAQYLAILKLQLDSILHSGKIQSPDIIEKLQYLDKDAGRAVDDIRRYSHELRPTVLEHLGLQAALEQIAEDTNKLQQIKVEIHIEGKEPELSEEAKLGLFRIAQEALNNCRKHSRASQAALDLQFHDRGIKIQVKDNGIGFNTQEAVKRSSLKGSLGLMSMQERARLIGADLKIQSQPGEGTTVIIAMPLLT